MFDHASWLVLVIPVHVFNLVCMSFVRLVTRVELISIDPFSYVMQA